MKTSSLGTLALAFTAAATLALPAVADAATYVSYLEYKNDAPNTKVATPFGKVTLTEVGLNSVDVVVTLFNPQVGFLNTGNKKDAGGNKSPFTFNLSGDYDVTVYNAVDQDFVDGGYGSFQNNNFGQYTNKIDCCKGKNGGANADPTDLHFLVTNTAVGGTLTFAGLGATFDSDGRLADPRRRAAVPVEFRRLLVLRRRDHDLRRHLQRRGARRLRADRSRPRTGHLGDDDRRFRRRGRPDASPPDGARLKAQPRRLRSPGSRPGLFVSVTPRQIPTFRLPAARRIA